MLFIFFQYLIDLLGELWMNLGGIEKSPELNERAMDSDSLILLTIRVIRVFRKTFSDAFADRIATSIVGATERFVFGVTSAT